MLPVPVLHVTLRERLAAALRPARVSPAGLPYGKVRTARDRGLRRATFRKGL